ncbi:hypothetical protein ACRCD5_00950 [Campylobacter taeniopygiae]|uniref:hypothetical protein n=1 Tax=Campylobacter taeniopygiae TaxID=2510188 RepID=UPI003D6A1402
MENYKIIFEEENKIHDEQDNEENENYSDVDNFKEFHGPTHLHSIDLKDMFKLARQMDEMMNYYQDEFEQNEEMDPKEKSLRNYLENHKHNALIGALSLTQEEFIKLSSKDFKRVQDYIDEALQEDVLKHLDICKIDDADLTVFKVKPLMQELNIETNFIKSKNSITKNIKEYFFDLLKAGAFVYAGDSERIATISHIYYFLQSELCEKYNEKKKALVFNNQLIEDFCSSLPNYKILNKVNLALQGCLVTRGKNRILMLDDIEDLYEDWGKEEYIEVFITDNKNGRKLIAYDVYDLNLSEKELNQKIDIFKEQVKQFGEKFNFDTIETFLSERFQEESDPDPLKENEDINLDSKDENDDIKFIPLSLEEQKNIREILNLDESKNIESFHQKIINKIFSDIFERLCGESSLANSILDDDTMYNLTHDQIFEFVMGKSVSKNTFKKINILTFMPVFKTKEDERYYTLEVEDKRIAFKLNQDSFKTLLKCGVVITEKHLKQLKEAKDLFALLHKLNVKFFNEYLHIHKGQKCTTRKGGLIYLNDLRKIDDLEDFLQSHPRFVMLEQILEILTQIKDLNSSQKEEFLQNYDFKNWEYENNEIFIYDKVETKYNNSMRFINSKKENRKPKSEIRLLAHTQIDCNEQEIEEQAVELFEGFSQNEAEFALIMILDYLNMVQESEFDNILDVKIIKSSQFHANTNFYQSLDEFLKKEEIFNIIFIRDSNEIFYYLSKVFRILRFKINFNFCLKNTDTELQVFVIENEQNKNLKTALFIGTSVEEIGILKFIKEKKFNKNALPFMANLYVEIDGAMALNSCFYQGRYTLKYKDEFYRNRQIYRSYFFFLRGLFFKIFKK